MGLWYARLLSRSLPIAKINSFLSTKIHFENMQRIKSMPFFSGSGSLNTSRGVVNRLTSSGSSYSGSKSNVKKKSVLLNSHPQTRRVEIEEDDAVEVFAADRQNNYYSVQKKLHRRTSSGVSALDNTDHNRKGSGILAARRDIEMDDDVFAAGCKLLLAAARGDLNMVRRLLQDQNNNITVNFRDYDRRTALHVAASEGHLHMVKCLVEEFDCMINRSDRWGGSPLDDAHRHRNMDVVLYLRSRGAQTGTTDLSVALISAAANGGESISTSWIFKIFNSLCYWKKP